MQLNHDQPLDKKDALEPGKDKLGRRGFAESVVKALSGVNKERGLVLSIEGKWGSGKTSTLAMVEALLDQQMPKPLVVHFNPWLVGDRDALLGQFLSKVGKAAKLSDHAANGKRVAKEIDAYANAFDVIKLIPGAEPWATIVKSVFTSVGSATGTIADYKTPDLEERKQKVEEALKKLAQPIIVVVDDVDRLFPKEVFEIVRIIKAVGDLPNIGYVLTWDTEYVEAALKSADVATADVYLDKIVQVRLRLPAMSEAGKKILLDEAYLRLPSEAREAYFSDHQNLLGFLLESGLRKVLAQPRDVARLFNTVGLIEPALRGEVVLADIIGLSTLMNFAEPLYKLLVQSRLRFSGSLAFNQDTDFDGAENGHLKVWAQEREAAIAACRNPEATQAIVKFLFPQGTVNKNGFSKPAAVELDGRINHPQRLAVALQGGVGPGEVSLWDVQNFVLVEGKRKEILERLTGSNWRSFLDAVQAAKALCRQLSDDQRLEIYLSLARAADDGPFTVDDKFSQFLSGPKSVWLAVSALAESFDAERASHIALQLAKDDGALTVASMILDTYFLDVRSPRAPLIFVDQDHRAEACLTFGLNVLGHSKRDDFWKLPAAGSVLQVLGEVAPECAKQVFEAIALAPDKVNKLIASVLFAGTSSVHCDYYDYTVKSKILEAFGPLSEFKSYALANVGNAALDPETRAALRSIVEEKQVFKGS
jgi:hypothetical protein